MRKITKILGLGAAVALAGTVALTALAETPAQSGPGAGPGMMQGGGMGHGMGMGAFGHGPMLGAFGDPATRLAALKTELGITSAQEAAWNTYAKTVQDTTTAWRAEHQNIDRAKIHAMSDQERQAFFTQRQQEQQKAFDTIKASAEKLTATLSDFQKGKASEILPGLAPQGRGMMWHAGFGGSMMQHGDNAR
jgi:LTXXQ motif family protein